MQTIIDNKGKLGLEMIGQEMLFKRELTNLDKKDRIDKPYLYQMRFL